MKVDLVQCLRRFLAYLGAKQLEVARQPQAQAGLAWLASAFS